MATARGTGQRPRPLLRATRRALVLGLALAALLATAAGSCSPAEDEVPVPRLEDHRPLLIAGGASSTGAKGKDALRQLIERWNDREGVRPAQLVPLPQDVDAQRSQLIGTLQSGQADYDVLMLDPPWIPEFAAEGFIRPLDEELLNPVFVAGAEESAEWDGEVYAVPFITDVGLLFYRADLLADRNVDEKLLQSETNMATLLGALTDDEDPPWYIAQLAQYEGLAVSTFEAFWSTGSDGGIDLVDDEGEWAGSYEKLREGLQTLESVADEGKISKLAFEANEPRALAEFTSKGGGTVMMRGWPDSYYQLPAGDDYSVTMLPGRAALGGRSLAIAEGSEYVEDAEELIRFLTHERDSQRALLNAGSPAALRAAYELPAPEEELCRALPPVRRPHGADEEAHSAHLADAQARTAETDSAEQAFRNLLWCALRKAHARPETENYAAFSQTLQGEVHAMITSAEVGPDDAARCLNVLLPPTLNREPPKDPGTIDDCSYG